MSRLQKTSPKQVRIPLDELEEAVFKKRLCLGFLVLRARRLESFKDVPGNATGELRLRCRQERLVADDLRKQKRKAMAG